jgi:hypothetical protein
MHVSRTSGGDRPPVDPIALRDGGFSLDLAHYSMHVLGSPIFGSARIS